MVIFLDSQHRVITHRRLFSGTLNHVEVHPREIIREAIKINASALILHIITLRVVLNPVKRINSLLNG